MVRKVYPLYNRSNGDESIGRGAGDTPTQTKFVSGLALGLFALHYRTLQFSQKLHSSASLDDLKRMNARLQGVNSELKELYNRRGQHVDYVPKDVKHDDVRHVLKQLFDVPTVKNVHVADKTVVEATFTLCKKVIEYYTHH